jgi:hypothetical protein
MILSGDSTVEELATSMSELATNTSEALTNLAEFGKSVRDIFGPIASGVEKFIKFTQPLADLVIEGDPTGFTGRPRPRARRMFEGGQDSVAEAKLAKLRADALAKETANQRRLRQEKDKAARAEKNKVSLSKAAAAFDSTRISIAAALQATYDKETKLRLEALMLIEEDRGDEALKKISELAKLQKNADLQRLAGVDTISNATLSALNTQLLNELKVINTSKMAEGDKELAREEAFKKYNAAITAAGALAAKESYNERVQIQLTEIARLASISKTYNASATAALLLESSELSMIDRVAKAQAAADAARLASLKEYMALLNGQKYNPLSSFVGRDETPPPAKAPFYDPLSSFTGRNELPPVEPFRYDPLSSFNNRMEVTINAGIGDPEAIARAVEDVLNQSTYRGTTVNRGAGQYYV